MHFEVETTYDQATIFAFQNILNHTLRAKRIRFVRIVAGVIGCISLLYGMLWIWASAAAGTGWSTMMPAVTGLLAGSIFLALSIFYEKYINRRGRHMVNQNPTVVKYIFDENGYTTQMERTKTRSIYGIIQYICCDNNYFAIMLDRKRGFVLDKNKFLNGDAVTFAGFLEEKTGRKMQRLRQE